MNEIPIAIKQVTFESWSKFIATIPKELITNYPTKITFKVPSLYRPSDYEKNPDNRLMGISICEINLIANEN